MLGTLLAQHQPEVLDVHNSGSSPGTLVFVLFITAHLFVENEGSGIYLPETNWEGNIEEVFPVPYEEIDPSMIDPETGGILPDKYNYLKIENVFSGKIIGSEKLFSIEVALLTKQPSIASDLFISHYLKLKLTWLLK